jgi:hypothetical protein
MYLKINNLFLDMHGAFEISQTILKLKAFPSEGTNLSYLEYVQKSGRYYL